MEDEATFQVDPRGPGGSEYCAVRWGRIDINAAVMRWTTPTGGMLTPVLVLRCPQCDFPITAKPDHSAEFRVEQGRLTLRQMVRCPGHWPSADANGNLITDAQSGRVRRASCDWAVIILDGRAHRLNCPAVSRHGPRGCTCAEPAAPKET